MIKIKNENESTLNVSLQQLRDTLGYPVSEQEFLSWRSQIKILSPKLGGLWQSAKASSGIYIVLAGKVKLIDSQDKLLATEKALTSFGECTLFPQANLIPYSVEVCKNVKLAYLPSGLLSPLIDRYPEILEQLYNKAQVLNSLLLPSHKPSVTSFFAQHGLIPKSTLPDNGDEDTLIDLHVPNPQDDWSEAKQELLDAVPQVWTRGFLYFLMMSLGISLPFAMLSKIDATATAKGRLEPKDETIGLDAPVEEEVAAINVKEGDRVKAGQTLVELKSDVVTSELQQQQILLEGQQNRLSQLELLYNQLTISLNTQQQQNQTQKLARQAQIEQAKQNLKYLITVSELHKQEKEAKVEQARQEIKSSNLAHKIAKMNLITSQEKLLRYQKSDQKDPIAKEGYLEAEKIVKENQENLNQALLDIDNAHSKLKEAQDDYKKILQQSDSEIKQADLRYQEQERSYKTLVDSGESAILKSQEQLNNWSRQIASIKTKIAQTNSKIESLQLQLKQRKIKAPIDGIVYELPVKNEGIVVQPGEVIAEIAPKGSPLVIRAQIATSESGSLEKGKKVPIKFDGDTLQDYGVLEGKLVDIAPTSKVTENEQGSMATYDLEIELDRDCIPNQSECIPLNPGETVTAEVIVGQRNVVDRLIAPFNKLQQNEFELL